VRRAIANAHCRSKIKIGGRSPTTFAASRGPRVLETGMILASTQWHLLPGEAIA